MLRFPADFPWQVMAALLVAVLCLLGAVFCVLVAVGRVLRDRRRRDSRPGYVAGPLVWDERPNEFTRDWRS